MVEVYLRGPGQQRGRQLRQQQEGRAGNKKRTIKKR